MSSPSPAEIDRDSVAVQDTWKLDDLYDPSEVEREIRDAAASVETLPRHRGSLASAAGQLARVLDEVADVEKRLSRLYTYAQLEVDSDTRRPAAQARKQRLEMLWTRFQAATAWVRPEILAIPDDTLDAFLEQEPALTPHRHGLRDLRRTREHVRSPAEEEIIAGAGLISGAAYAVFGLLNDAELPRGEIVLRDGSRVRLTPAAYQRHRSSSVREDRAAIFREHFRAYAGFRDTFGQMLFEAVKRDVFRARVRSYPSCLDAALDGENIPRSVYHTLIEQIRAGLPTLHRYFGLRARALQLDALEYHDLPCPIVPDGERRYEATAARRLVCEALSPLGDRYSGALAAAFDERWIDWHPTAGKRSGAYSTGAAYDVHPYVLMNYNGDYESVSTLAHELGHAMHSHFSNATQPYPTASYSIFVAEVASTFNECLVHRRALDEAESDRERLALIGRYLDGLRGTLFRQTMFAEFELAIHERTERGEALTGEALSEMYLALLREYHGHAAGVLEVDERYAIEWASIPHFYYNFYVYQYATGITAAMALARGVLAGDEGQRERYLGFLAAGGSDYPLAILRRAGVDLETAEPYRATFAMMDEMLDHLEALIDGV